MPAGPWTRNSIKSYFQEYPEIMTDYLWIFQVQLPSKFNPGARTILGRPASDEVRTVQDPKGFVPVLPVLCADYQKDPLVNLLLLLWRMEEPKYDIHVSITTAELLNEAQLRFYTYTQYPPLVDVVCGLCAQVVKSPAGEKCVCEDCQRSR